MSNVESTLVDAVSAASQPTAELTPEQTQAAEHARYAQEVVAAGTNLRHGFMTGKPKKGEESHADDQLDMLIIRRLAAEVAPGVISDETIGKDVFVQGHNILSELTAPAAVIAKLDALRARLEKKLANLRLCDTTRVTFRNNIPARMFAMAYIGFGGSKKDVATTMLFAPLIDRK